MSFSPVCWVNKNNSTWQKNEYLDVSFDFMFFVSEIKLCTEPLCVWPLTISWNNSGQLKLVHTFIYFNERWHVVTWFKNTIGFWFDSQTTLFLWNYCQRKYNGSLITILVTKVNRLWLLSNVFSTYTKYKTAFDRSCKHVANIIIGLLAEVSHL